MCVPYLLARREGDHRVYRDFMEMADRASDPHLKRALRRRADEYHPRHLAEADRTIDTAFRRAFERSRGDH